MSTQTPQTRTLTGWSEVLAILERTLSHWLAHADVPAEEPPPQPGVPLPLQEFEKRLDRLQAYLDRAEQSAEQALGPLTVEIETLKRWLETVNTARGNLLARTARAG
jgi:hypothetical protein